MDQIAYQQWWQLHLRSCRGESLDEAERARYEAGLKSLHSEEVFVTDLEPLREARESLRKLDAQCDQLHVQRRQLKAKLSRIEAALSQDTRQRLGIQD